MEIATVGQGSNLQWIHNRLQRLTASHFGAVIKRKPNPSEAFVRNILSPRNISSLPAVSYFTEHEDRARNIDTLTMNKLLKHSIQVFGNGLIVYPAYPHIGASPDWQVVDTSFEES